MFFRQFLEPVSSTWTYLLADRATGDAVIIDPVLETVDRDIQNILDLGLTLRWTLETHVHADHITAAAALKDRLGCQTGVSAHAGLDCVDRALVHGDRLTFGGHALTVVETPGHTLCSLSYLTDGPHRMAFTGDALLIRGCGAHRLPKREREQALSGDPPGDLQPPRRHDRVPRPRLQRAYGLDRRRGAASEPPVDQERGGLRRADGRAEPAAPEAHRRRRAREPTVRPGIGGRR